MISYPLTDMTARTEVPAPSDVAQSGYPRLKRSHAVAFLFHLPLRACLYEDQASNNVLQAGLYNGRC